MQRNRLEAFSDGVIAIIITIMVLELRAPKDAGWIGLQSMLPVFLSYAMSFVYLGIYWNNHHHMLHAAEHVDGRILWANMHLLFWLSLFPFCTSWMEESGFAAFPTAVYGCVLFLAALAFKFLMIAIVSHHGEDGLLRKAIGNDRKGNLSIIAYVLAIPLSFLHPWIAISIFVLVGMLWFIPDRRIETMLHHDHA